MEPKLNDREDSKPEELNKAGLTLRPAIGTILGLLSNEPPWNERKGNRNKLPGRNCVGRGGRYCGEAGPGVNIGVGIKSKPYSFLFFSTAIFNVDDSVVDLETLAALYENVSVKRIRN